MKPAPTRSHSRPLARKTTLLAAAALALTPLHSSAEEPQPAPPQPAAEAPLELLGKHRDGSERMADEQDELSADIQQLALEQTIPQVIELFNECTEILDEAIDRLLQHDTGGLTLAAQTEVIEKIHEAAKQRQQQSGGQAGGAMMDMMERMMGQNPSEGQQPGKEGEGEGEGEQGGKGQTGESDTGNQANPGDLAGKGESRRIPKATGRTGAGLPEEFRSTLEAYNRGAEQLAK